MSHYQTPQDLQLASTLAGLAPTEARSFLAYYHAAKRCDVAIPPKTLELIALAVALTTQCGYCLDVHSRAAKRLGTTREELAEIALIAAAVRAGATVGHGLMALRLFDEAPVARIATANINLGIFMVVSWIYWLNKHREKTGTSKSKKSKRVLQ